MEHSSHELRNSCCSHMMEGQTINISYIAENSCSILCNPKEGGRHLVRSSLFFFSSTQTIAEFDLRAVCYEVKSPRCHELSLATPPHDRITFNFRCEREAQEWATVVMSSLREAHRGQFPSRPMSFASFLTKPFNQSSLKYLISLVFSCLVDL